METLHQQGSGAATSGAVAQVDAQVAMRLTEAAAQVKQLTREWDKPCVESENLRGRLWLLSGNVRKLTDIVERIATQRYERETELATVKTEQDTAPASLNTTERDMAPIEVQELRIRVDTIQ